MAIRIDGKKFAEKILFRLKDRVEADKLHPHLEVILIGDTPASLSYIRQKQKAAETIGATLHITQFPVNVTKKELNTAITQYNKDSSISGLILQLPIPKEADIPTDVIQHIASDKDVDGFVAHSTFQVPVARAVFAILEHIYYQSYATTELDVIAWLRGLDIVVVGKGKTAGIPIKNFLESMSLPVVVIDRSTPKPHEILKKAHIIISCTGVPNLITSSHLRSGVILLSVGLSNVHGKLAGDYDEHDIQEKAAFYTPTPGGVGPVNVACLMENLVTAAKNK